MLIVSMAHFMIYVGPGPVSDPMAYPRFTSLELTWNAPEVPNGRIICYAITYLIDAEGVDSTPVTLNVSDATSVVIPNLRPWSSVSDISIAPYTSAGRGTISRLPALEDLQRGEVQCHSRWLGAIES